MGLILAFARVLYFTTALLLLWVVSEAKGNINASSPRQGYKVFDVRKYGAVSDGKTDNSKAFLKAWKEACEWHGKAMVLIPPGVYVLDSVVFQGECNGHMAFFLKGILKPKGNLKNHDQWINFKYINGFTLGGGGTLDGEGHKVWHKKCPGCPSLPISLGLGFINGGLVRNIRSFNSQSVHISLFGCTNVNMSRLRVSAPGESPNTDGIKIGASQHIKIWKSTIGTGDDCIAILPKSEGIDISGVYCGPGHGISVGSMGGKGSRSDQSVVKGLTVKNCTFNGTSDGVRIKTWASSTAGLASNFTYQNIRIINVDNPIVITQQYCPYPPCEKTPSRIQIKDITFDNIWGISKSKVAVSLNCSPRVPCKNIVLKDIDLIPSGGGSATSSCSNVHGHADGRQRPPSCL